MTAEPFSGGWTRFEPAAARELARQQTPRHPAAPASRTGGRVCFLYIAEQHQTLHSIGAAVELARLRPDLAVELVTTQPETVAYLRRVVALLEGHGLTLRLLGPRWLRAIRLGSVPAKLPMLLANAAALNRYDVIVTPERTTAVLRRFGVRRPRLVYTQHGAGDRGGPFEPRLRRFDMVFAAGPKQRDRMAQEGLVSAERCAVVGYPKFDVVDALTPKAPALFAQDRPVVLYNPHFDPRLSSWPRWGQAILKAFANQSRYNLIFAPHIRMFGAADPRTIPSLAPFLDHPDIHLDLGTPASINMTYTRMADVYLGDASSQVYEFLRARKPCLFLDAHAAVWQGAESYRHWTFGPVVSADADIVTEVDRARSTHLSYLRAQNESFEQTFDLAGETSSVRAARAIARLV